MIDGKSIIVFKAIHIRPTMKRPATPGRRASSGSGPADFFTGPANPVNPKAYNDGPRRPWKAPNLPGIAHPQHARFLAPSVERTFGGYPTHSQALPSMVPSPAFTASVDAANGQTVNAVQPSAHRSLRVPSTCVPT